MKFRGRFCELQALVDALDFDGDWRDLGNQKQFRTLDGAILNWWVSSGTIYFQGHSVEAAEFEKELDAELSKRRAKLFG